MDSSLQIVELRIATVAADQLIMCSVLDDATALDGDDAVRVANGRQTVCNDEHGPAGGDLLHILLNHPLALIIQRTRCLVKNQNSRIGDESAGDGNTLALPT